MGVNLGGKVWDENIGEKSGGKWGKNHKLWGKISGVKSGGKTLGVKVGEIFLGEICWGENMEDNLRT